MSPQKAEHLLLKLPSLSLKVTGPSEEASPDLEDEDTRLVCEDNNAKQSAEYDYMGHGVQFSQKIEVQNLYKALMLLLESSLASAEASKESVNAFVPKDGSELSCELCTLSEDAYSWQRVSIKEVSYNLPPRLQKGQIFHVLCVLGHGGTGRRFCVAHRQAKCLQPSYSSSLP